MYAVSAARCVYKGGNGSEWYPEHAQVYSEATRTW